MGLLTVVAIAVIIALPLEASPITHRNVVQINVPASWRKYFGKPSSHLKYIHVPRSQYNDPKESAESDNYIEQLIREAIQGPHNVERKRRSGPKLEIDTDYYLIIEKD